METVELVKIDTTVTKEIYELGDAIKTLMVETKKALADGWQPVQDVPAIMMNSFSKLTTAISGVDKMPNELKEEAIKAIMGLLIPVAEGLDVLLEKGIKEDVAN